MFKLFRRSVSSPVPEAERAFLDRSLLWLASEFSWEPALAPVVTPTSEFFPDDWLGTDEEIDDLMERVCRMMRVPAERVQLEIFADDEDPIQSLVPVSKGRRSGPAGLFFDKKRKGRFIIAVSERILGDALTMVSTLAHELAHVHLLGDKRISAEDENHEKVTDLLTIFFGLGLFTANSAFQFSQWDGGGWHGWETSRLGYLDEPSLGYALAAYGWVRGESDPKWQKYLAQGVLPYFRQAARFLAESGESTLPRAPRTQG